MARVLAAVVADPSIPLTVKSLAIASGLTDEDVRRTLANPVFRDVVENKAATLGVSYMCRGLAEMNTIVTSSKSTDASKVAAFKAVVSAYATLADVDPKRMQQAKYEQVERALEQLEKANASTGRIPDRQAS